MIIKNKYQGITYFLSGLQYFNFILGLWKRFMCPRGWHLLDEVLSNEDHYMICDACELVVNIDSIEVEDDED